MRKTNVCRLVFVTVAFSVFAQLVAAPAMGAPAWLASIPLSLAGQEVGDPQVAVDASGDAVTLWEGPDNGVQAAFRTALGGVWQLPIVLSQGVGEVSSPDVAIDPGGDMVVAAWGRDGTVEIAEGSARNPTWYTPTMLSPESQGAENPHVAVDAQGGAVAVWEGVEHRLKTVQAAYRPATSRAWQAPPVTLSGTWPSNYAGGDPWVAINGQGDAVAAWERQTEDSWRIEASVRPVATGEWQAPVPIVGQNPPGSSGALLLGIQVALDAQGDAVAVWEHYMQNNWFIEAAIRPASGNWQVPVRLSTAGLGGARPDLALDAQGDAVVVWEGATATQRTVEVAAGSAVSGIWRAPARLATWHHLTERFLPWVRVPGFHATPTAQPRVAVDAHGDAIAVWEQAASYYSGVIQAAGMVAGRDVWQAPMDVAPASTEGLSVALDEQGEAISAWSRIVDEGSNVVEASALAKLAITRAHLSNRRFRAARHRDGRSVRGTIGTSLYFTLSEPAEVKIAITHSAPGVRSYDGCVAPRATNPRLHLRPCIRRVTLVTLKRSHLPAGLDSVYLSGRVAHHALSPGTYRAILTAGTASTLSSPVTLSFTVVR